MEKLEEQKIEITKKTHHFYCDECGEYLGASEECSDGYYPEIGDFELKLNIQNCWYEKKNNLCDKCRKIFVDSFIEFILEKGFIKE